MQVLLVLEVRQKHFRRLFPGRLCALSWMAEELEWNLNRKHRKAAKQTKWMEADLV